MPTVNTMILEAKKINDNKDFKASKGWLTKFLKRN